MGSAVIPTQSVVTQLLTYVSSEPVAYIIKVSGVSYSNGYTINYVSGFRRIFCGYDSATQAVSLYCQQFAYGEDLPALSLTGIEVNIIG